MALLLPGFGRWVAWCLSSRRFLLCSLRYYSSVVHISLVASLNLEKLTFSVLKCQFLFFSRPNTIFRHFLSYIHTCLSLYICEAFYTGFNSSFSSFSFPKTNLDPNFNPYICICICICRGLLHGNVFFCLVFFIETTHFRNRTRKKTCLHEAVFKKKKKIPFTWIRWKRLKTM